MTISDIITNSDHVITYYQQLYNQELIIQVHTSTIVYKQHLVYTVLTTTDHYVQDHG
jgi:hypothetical protein